LLALRGVPLEDHLDQGARCVGGQVRAATTSLFIPAEVVASENETVALIIERLHHARHEGAGFA
jgi:hypothetical protein